LRVENTDTKTKTWLRRWTK